MGVLHRGSICSKIMVHVIGHAYFHMNVSTELSHSKILTQANLEKKNHIAAQWKVRFIRDQLEQISCFSCYL